MVVQTQYGLCQNVDINHIKEYQCSISEYIVFGVNDIDNLFNGVIKIIKNIMISYLQMI